jgi:hypothetical protein
MLSREFNWTPTQIDDVDLGYYYALCESFDRFPPHYMLFPASIGYEAKSSVKYKEFDKILENQNNESTYNDLISIFGKANGK